MTVHTAAAAAVAVRHTVNTIYDPWDPAAGSAPVRSGVFNNILESQGRRDVWGRTAGGCGPGCRRGSF